MGNGKKLSSEELAALIADALVSAGLVARVRLEDAISLIEQEINARKGVGDY